MVHRESFGEKVFKVLNYVLLAIFGFMTLYPFIYFLVLSLNDGFDAMKGGIYLWPRAFTWENYLKAFQNKYIVSAFEVSLFRTIVGTLISFMLTAMLAFALTKKGLPGRTVIVFYFFFTTLFNGGLIPYYILLRELHLTTSVWIYVLPSIYSFFNVIIMRVFFDGIPISLAESAHMDGCSDLRVFFQIYLPLSGPVIATVVLFYGVGHWNDWYTGTFFVTNKKIIPAATLLQQILTESTFETNLMTNTGGGINNMMEGAKARTTPESLRMAFVMIMTVPIVCIYPFLQKYFVNGVMLGSIKG